jgi:hypothetical protein
MVHIIERLTTPSMVANTEQQTRFDEPTSVDRFINKLVGLVVGLGQAGRTIICASARSQDGARLFDSRGCTRSEMSDERDRRKWWTAKSSYLMAQAIAGKKIKTTLDSLLSKNSGFDPALCKFPAINNSRGERGGRVTSLRRMRKGYLVV